MNFQINQFSGFNKLPFSCWRPQESRPIQVYIFAGFDDQSSNQTKNDIPVDVKPVIPFFILPREILAPLSSSMYFSVRPSVPLIVAK